MSDRLKLHFGVSVFLTVLVLVGSSYARAQQGKPEFITLNPIGSFPVPGDPSMKLRAIDSSDGFIRFLLAGKQGTEVQETDNRGRVHKVTPLTVYGRPEGLCMSYDDSLAVKFRGGIVNVYNPSGELAQTLPTGRETDACALIAPTVVAITDHGVSRFRSGSLDRLLSAPPQPLLWPTTSVLLNNNRVGIIEMGEAMLNIVDMSSGSWQRFQLLAPEIQGVRRPVRTAKEVIPEIFAAAADLASGDIYVATGPFYVKIGASILRVTDEGVLKERLRCTLPTSPNFITSHNPEGQFLVTYMAIANGVLILVSESQWHCFYYKLP